MWDLFWAIGKRRARRVRHVHGFCDFIVCQLKIEAANLFESFFGLGPARPKLYPLLAINGVFLERIAWDVVLVTFMVTQTTSVIVRGRFCVSRIVFHRKTTASRCAKRILDTQNRPIMIEQGLWGRQSLHQSLPDQKNIRHHTSTPHHPRPP
jgi:hypothetical protein